MKARGVKASPGERERVRGPGGETSGIATGGRY